MYVCGISWCLSLIHLFPIAVRLAHPLLPYYYYCCLFNCHQMAATLPWSLNPLDVPLLRWHPKVHAIWEGENVGYKILVSLPLETA